MQSDIGEYYVYHAFRVTSSLYCICFLTTTIIAPLRFEDDSIYTSVMDEYNLHFFSIDYIQKLELMAQ